MKGDGKGRGGICSEKFPLAAKVAIVAIGGLFVLAVLLFLALLRREKRKMRDLFQKNGGPVLQNVHHIKLFKKEELQPILKKRNIIGKGGFGEVYKGRLDDNTLVAVKKSIRVNATLQEDQFTNEIIIQSRVIHKNIVKLIGCCLEVDIPMLVYEFVANGSLDDILHGNDRKTLSLDARLNIAAQTAEGLAYMHSKTNDTILHGDVKPANILLDNNFDPKISDFGLSRLIAIDKQHTKYVVGDTSYVDPIYLQEGLLTDKSDVYSFGVVLLELVSRMKATNNSGDGTLVAKFLRAHENRRRATELFDKDFTESKDMDLLHSVVDIAVKCLCLNVDERPEMTDIAERFLMLKRVRLG
uniref:Protein kinase domain-containing protein n=1 Tax=Oryza barthii TaxID=65489 RepID=A0A0D3FUT4_9ORYZ